MAHDVGVQNRAHDMGVQNRAHDMGVQNRARDQREISRNFIYGPLLAIVSRNFPFSLHSFPVFQENMGPIFDLVEIKAKQVVRFRSCFCKISL